MQILKYMFSLCFKFSYVLTDLIELGEISQVVAVAAVAVLPIAVVGESW